MWKSISNVDHSEFPEADIILFNTNTGTYASEWLLEIIIFLNINC